MTILNFQHNLFDDDIGGDLGVGIDSTREPLPGTSKDMLGDSLGDPHMDENGFGDDFGRKLLFLFGFFFLLGGYFLVQSSCFKSDLVYG